MSALISFVISKAISLFILYFILFSLYWWLWGEYKDNFKKWKSWPTLAEYWDAHPESRTRTGTRCHHCGSTHIRFQHFTNKSHDCMLIHKCQHCQTTLYRSAYSSTLTARGR